jgi:hypothetical protein
MSSMSSKCLPFNISFIFGKRKKSLGARSFSSLRKSFHPLVNCCFLHSIILVTLH